MRISLISDLHLAPGRLNRCTSSPQALLALLDDLATRSDHVVLGGDAFDLSRAPTPGRWRAHLEALRREQPALMARLEALPAVFGNHDEARKADGCPEELIYRSGPHQALISHGHQADSGLKRVPGLAAAANMAAGWLLRAELAPLSRGVGQVPALMDAISGGSTQGQRRAARLAGQYARQEGAQVVMMGHTHQLRLDALDSPDTLLIQAGSHAHGHMDAAWLDLAQGRAELWRDGRLVAAAERDQDRRWRRLAAAS